ncbi:MAG: hypothetical protein AB1778_08580 [Candidatus Bipolaricaulota bacterium]
MMSEPDFFSPRPRSDSDERTARTRAVFDEEEGGSSGLITVVALALLGGGLVWIASRAAKRSHQAAQPVIPKPCAESEGGQHVFWA